MMLRTYLDTWRCFFSVSESVALYWSIGAFKEVNDWQNALQRYPEIHKKLFEQPDSRPNEQELKDLMLGLRSHLAINQVMRKAGFYIVV